MSDLISRAEVQKLLLDATVERAGDAATDADLSMRRQARQAVGDTNYQGTWMSTDRGLFTFGSTFEEG